MKYGALLLFIGVLFLTTAFALGCSEQQPTTTPPVPTITPPVPTIVTTPPAPDADTGQGTPVATDTPGTPEAVPETPPTVIVLGGPTTTPDGSAATTTVTVPKATPFQLPPPTAQPSDTPLSKEVDGYVAIAPRELRSGRTGSISVSLFDGGVPAQGIVRVSLDTGGREAATASGLIMGNGSISLPVPDLPPDNYRLTVEGPGFNDTASLRVESGATLFLETDKPIYKPGQKVMMRVLTVGPELRPLTGEVTIEVQDAKGSKVFKQTVATGEYGMATLDMPLSSEPNLGVWKITAHLIPPTAPRSSRSVEATTELDVRVEEYVLPKYEVTVDLPRGWVLANEEITGRIDAEYTFGRPVKGEVEIVATRYVGVWEEFATLTRQIDGSESFELPPVYYVAGVPAGRGMGNVNLDVTVREKSTGYEETTTRLLTVAESPVNLHLVSESSVFKPSLPFSFLVVTETPDNKPVDKRVTVSLEYLDEDLELIETREQRVSTRNGTAILTVEPPEDAVGLSVGAHTGDAWSFLEMRASYSPSGSFIHVVQEGPTALNVGDTARFKVHTTRETTNLYYEVVARGKVVFSQISDSPEISFTVTPVMAPGARLLVYQVLPDGEVAADYIPFNVAAVYPHQVQASFGKEEVMPGEPVDINVETQGPAQVGLVAVDRSVFILAENRLNLQQVFNELERLYMQPQVELHDVRIRERIPTRGAMEAFQDAGVVVMTNKDVPEGQEYRSKRKFGDVVMQAMGGAMVRKGVVMQESAPAAMATPLPMATAVPAAAGGAADELAEVSRVRQFFPETWLWTDVTTNEEGLATVPVEAPYSITTWVLRAVGLSREHGLGIAESELKVFQPFFLSVDLPFAGIRGEVLPAKVALYNYLDSPQTIQVDLSPSDGYELLDSARRSVTVGPNDIGGAEFRIRLADVGKIELEVSARSTEAADAVIKEMLVEPEGVPEELVENLVLTPGTRHSFDGSVPRNAVEDSARTLVSVSGSYLAQTIDGLEGLLQMPFGCGEQNMILFAPNVFVADYLRDTGQIKPEVMAKAERLMITGYQRELTYRRGDGSFSAFGDSDEEGSLWLTAFVLKTFSQAQGMIHIDPDILNGAQDWILRHQRGDGSFEPVGFLHHQELLGGLKGNTALTAYVAIALLESGERAASSKAIDYLEGELDGMDDPYTVAIASYALELAGSNEADAAYDKLMSMAEAGDGGLSWGSSPVAGGPGTLPRDRGMVHPPRPDRSAAVETTGYATLALLEHGDIISASNAGKWLVNQRNAYGGYGSTQDTVVGLQALTRFAVHARSDVEMSVSLSAGDWEEELSITPENADVVHILEVPAGSEIKVSGSGRGQVVVQAVRRFNTPEVETVGRPVFDIDVDYGTDRVDVDDLITVSADVTFNPPRFVEAGMVVLDVSIPTGFGPVMESIQRMAESEPRIKRHDVAGRKVIIYIEDMEPGETLSLEFQARALFPVRAEPVTSSVYSYYRPEWRGQSLGGGMNVGG